MEFQKTSLKALLLLWPIKIPIPIKKNSRYLETNSLPQLKSYWFLFQSKSEAASIEDLPA